MTRRSLTSKGEIDEYYESLEPFRPQVTTTVKRLAQYQDMSEVEEIVQKTFVAAYQTLRNQKKTFDKPLAWLRRTAHNLYYDFVDERKRKGWAPLNYTTGTSRGQDTGPIEFPSDPRYLPDIALSRKESIDTVTEKIDTFSNEKMKKVMALYILGYTTSEIAECLGISQSYVRTCVARGKAVIRSIDPYNE